MPQTLSFNLVHIIFSTKNRSPFIHEMVTADLQAQLAATARSPDCDCFRVGGVADHVQLAIKLPMTRPAAKIVSEIKTSFSAWMKTQGMAKFAWQRGYGLFSVSPADIGALIRYVETQPEHHARRGFEDEMHVFYKKYHVAFDEQYVRD